MLYLVDVNYIGKSSFLQYLIFPLFIYSLISSLPKEKIISCIAEKYVKSPYLPRLGSLKIRLFLTHLQFSVDLCLSPFYTAKVRMSFAISQVNLSDD